MENIKKAARILSRMSGDDVITLIVFCLEAAIQHSSDPEAWKTPEENPNEFYYAYSHASFICACLWAQHINDSVEAETFTDLLENPPKDMEAAVRELLIFDECDDEEDDLDDEDEIDECEDDEDDFDTTLELDAIPADFPVQPLRDDENPPGRTTCGQCGLSWDDDKCTSMTPTPSGRCPFEYFHVYPKN